jgi:hypothetical protein
MNAPQTTNRGYCSDVLDLKLAILESTYEACFC